MCSPALMQQAQSNGPTPTGSISKSGGNTQLPATALTPPVTAQSPQDAAVETLTPSALPSPAAAPAPASAPITDAPDAGSVSDFQTTHYGYADDKTPDSETKKGNGAFGKLTPGSLALTDSMAKTLGAKPGDAIELADAKGNKHQGIYIDRAPQANNRVDIYDPNGSEKAGAPFNAVSARKVSSVASKMFPKLS